MKHQEPEIRIMTELNIKYNLTYLFKIKRKHTVSKSKITVEKYRESQYAIDLTIGDIRITKALNGY